MIQKLSLKNFGPITNCELEINQFTVFTGPQSNGKSTVAKAVFFFRTVKEDILNIITLGGPEKTGSRKKNKWIFALKQRMRDKFLYLFGTSWIMPKDMEMRYVYTPDFWLRVFLVPGHNVFDNYIDFEFSDSFIKYLNELDGRSFENILPSQKDDEKRILEKELDDCYETIFIPAGRNLITLLSTQLNYIFTSLEGSQLRNIDYITRKYTELILKLKPLFGNGMLGLLNSHKKDSELAGHVNKHKDAIRILMQKADEILKGTYRCIDGEERLYLDDKKYIKINFTSSGQQEVVWVFNLLFYFLIEDHPVYLILEEPESHLYPSSQQTMGEVLSLFINENNMGLVTTHSPYLLGTINYLLLPKQLPSDKQRLSKVRIQQPFWLNPPKVTAYFVKDGFLKDAMDYDDDLQLIDNALIDDASVSINELSDYLIEQLQNEGD